MSGLIFSKNLYIIHTMNDIHSSSELNYRPRWLAAPLREAIASHQIIVLTGARQVGKSTLLQQEQPFAGWHYVTFDDLETLAMAKQEPEALWAGKDRIVLDEVQKSTTLLETIKAEVDANPGRYRFILSGSANLLLMKKVSESLAGRAVYFALSPMTLGEIHRLTPPKILQRLFTGQFPSEKEISLHPPNPYFLMWKGFMPPLLDMESSAVLRWWEGYITTYLERDLRQLSQIESLPDFRRLMAALALRCGQILNQTDLARDTGISQPTVHRYINLLETTYLVERLPAYAVNRTKRLVKSPKVMWSDPGLAAFLGGHFDPESLKNSREAGGLFESIIYLHLHTLTQLLTPKPRIYYWRTTTGKEVDFVLEWGRKLVAIEVKLAKIPKYSDTASLRLFLEEYPETSAGVLIHTGSETRLMHKKIIALPWTVLAGS
jgi:predicted AAA+ superfamily ATPase